MSFRRICIDNVSQVDLSSLSHESLCPHHGTGQAFPVNVRGEKKYRYRHGVQTDIGDVEESIWIELVKLLAERNNDLLLLNQYREFAKEDFDYAQRSIELEKQALDMYVRKCCDWKEWVGYIPFNRRYYPEKLNDPSLLKIIPDCCKEEGIAVPEQIRMNGDGQNVVPCPICGRYTVFEIIKKEI